MTLRHWLLSTAGGLVVAALTLGTVPVAGAHDDGYEGHRHDDDRYDRDRDDRGRYEDDRYRRGGYERDAPTRVSSLDDVVDVADVRSDGGEIRGRIENETGDRLEDVRLLVSDQFLWKNERSPGRDNPSGAHTVTVPGPIPPHGSVPFSFRRPSPLPDRKDGRFVTRVEAVEVTRRPAPDRGYESTRGYDRYDERYGDRDQRERYERGYRDDDRWDDDDRYDED